MDAIHKILNIIYTILKIILLLCILSVVLILSIRALDSNIPITDTMIKELIGALGVMNILLFTLFYINKALFKFIQYILNGKK